MNEAETRAEHIDPALKAAGWGVVEGSRIRRGYLIAIHHEATGLPRFRPLAYVNASVEELDQEKLTPLLRLKYHNSIADAVADLGQPEEIGNVFTGFQKYLYAAAV